MKSFLSGALVFALALLPSVASAQRDSSVYMEDRMNQLQQTITMLTGQVEQLQYQNQQLKQQLDKMQTDYDFRLDQIEKGKGGGGRARRGRRRRRRHRRVTGRRRQRRRPPAARQGEQLYHDAFKLLQDGDYAGAERAFKSFVQNNPKHPLAGNAQYWLGETYYARREYQQAMVAFAEGYKVYKTSPQGTRQSAEARHHARGARTRSRKPVRCSSASTRTIRAPPTCRRGGSTRSARRTAVGDAALGLLNSPHLMAPFAPFEARPALAVAVSGGRDSVALAVLAHRMGRRAAGPRAGPDRRSRPAARVRRRSRARPASGWRRSASKPRSLAWSGAKPATRIQQAAREARYRLLFEACRRHGILHLLTAHHADDQAETLAMRAARAERAGRAGRHGGPGRASRRAACCGRCSRCRGRG